MLKRFVLTAGLGLALTGIGSGDSAVAAVPDPLVTTGVTASGASGKVLLRWDANPEPHVARYHIHRKIGAGAWQYLASTLAGQTTFQDSAVTNGQNYSYYLHAESETGQANVYSSSATATANPDTSPPIAPTGVRASGSAHAITVAWNANLDPSVDGYKLYRRPSATSTWTLVTTTALTRYVDTFPANGQSFTYYVASKDLYAQNSAASSTVTATANPDTTPPADATGMTAYPGDGAINLTWTPSASADVKGFHVFRRPCAQTAVSWSYVATVSSNRFSDKWLDQGRQYCYYTRTFDDTDNTSNYSATASATPTRIKLRVGVVGNSDVLSTSNRQKLVNIGKPDTRIEFSLSDDPATLTSTFQNIAADGFRPLVLGNHGNSYPPSSDVSRFCGGIASRFGPSGTAGLPDASAVRYVEFGNESSYSYRTGTYTNPTAYAQLLQTCADAARAANPRVGVLAIAEDPASQNWVNTLYSQVPDLDNRIAGWTVHPYGNVPTLSAKLNQVVNDTAAHGSTLGIFATEYGISTDDGRTLEDDNAGWPKNLTYNQAGANLSTAATHARDNYPRLQQIHYYQLHDNRGHNAPADPGMSLDIQHYYGLFTDTLQNKGALTTVWQDYINARGL